MIHILPVDGGAFTFARAHLVCDLQVKYTSVYIISSVHDGLQDIHLEVHAVRLTKSNPTKDSTNCNARSRGAAFNDCVGRKGC